MSIPYQVLAAAAALLVASVADAHGLTKTHTHRFPVTVYVLEGAFTLELEGQAPIVVKAGSSLVEPPLVKMTGHNRSATEATKVVVFYVSDVDTPFLDLAH